MSTRTNTRTLPGGTICIHVAISFSRTIAAFHPDVCLRRFRFYGSSLLFVYEGEPALPGITARVADGMDCNLAQGQGLDPQRLLQNGSSEHRAEPQPAAVDVRMIDFAHVSRLSRTGSLEAGDLASHSVLGEGWIGELNKTVAGSGGDPGYALGLSCVIACLERVQREARL